MKYLLFIFIFTFNLYSLDFKVATYNVENFFDLHYDKTEYKEYRPNTKYWNQKSYNNKLKNINKVIKDLDADILALQEIESKRVLNALLRHNPDYKYSAFHKNKNSAIGLAIISKYKILSHSIIKVGKYDKYSRDILKVNLMLDNKPLIVYVNHWRSKRAKESKRIVYAMALKNEIDKQKDKDYIILGDLNSNYNEYQTFKYDKKLNDTYNITGINQILNTTHKGNFIHKTNILSFENNVHFNTWLELEKHQRFSSKFRNHNNTPDNIILSSTLFDTNNISYINNSFDVFKPSYLLKRKKVFRWNKTKKIGFSDHLPIYALFSTTKQNNINIQKKAVISKKNNTIDYLYSIEQIENYPIKGITVIYKTKNIAVIKQNPSGRAIMIYKPAKQLKTGFNYDLTVNSIDEYNGLKEIKKTSNIKLNHKVDSYKKYYINGNLIDLQNEKYLNNIIFGIKGIYKKRSLHFDNKKIRLYFGKGIKKPEEGKSISISSGHLSIYKSSMQLVLHREVDFITY